MASDPEAAERAKVREQVRAYAAQVPQWRYDLIRRGAKARDLLEYLEELIATGVVEEMVREQDDEALDDFARLVSDAAYLFREQVLGADAVDRFVPIMRDRVAADVADHYAYTPEGNDAAARAWVERLEELGLLIELGIAHKERQKEIRGLSGLMTGAHESSTSERPRLWDAIYSHSRSEHERDLLKRRAFTARDDAEPWSPADQKAVERAAARIRRGYDESAGREVG